MSIQVHKMSGEYKAVWWVSALTNKIEGVCEWEKL